MKKILIILIFQLIFCNPTLPEVATGYKYGKGTLKLTSKVANMLEYYFSGGKLGLYGKKQKQVWKPGFIVISSDGSDYYYFQHPAHILEIDKRQYVGQALTRCKKKSGEECYVFANGYKIVWDNGSDKKKRRLKRKDIKKGKTLQILKQLGFYDGNIATKKTRISKGFDTSENKSKTNEAKDNRDLVDKLMDLKKLYDEGALTKEQFEKSKNRILDES